MCGRFTLYTEPKILVKQFAIKEYMDFDPSYNIAPSQAIPVIYELKDYGRKMALMRWGLVPFWQKEEDITSSLINARVEIVMVKAAFRQAIQKRRCLIITNGFYEWQHNGKFKQPYFIHMKSGEPFAMAGLWERWSGDNKTIESCSILTTDAAPLIKSIHHRMPLIVPEDKYDTWLDPALQKADDIQKIIQSFCLPELEAYPVSKKVNSPQYNQKELLIKVDLLESSS